MKLITLNDGEQFKCHTPEQMVMHLWKSAWLRETTPYEYMRAVSRRVMVLNRHNVRCDTPTHFLEDIEAAGLVTIDWGTDEQDKT